MVTVVSMAGAVGVIGAGTMGAGIAQLAAASGCQVYLFDARTGAASQAKEGMSAQLDQRVAQKKLLLNDRNALLARVNPIANLSELCSCGVVIEAIVESMAPKRELFTHLEAYVARDAILASNTSSLSISALARDLMHRERFVGMHFFNPVHSMKLVEIVAGIDTNPAVVSRAVELAEGWGKTAVIARSTPGFIVNRIARPFYAEALMLLQEQRATPPQIDALIRGAGFKMGPCELMDLIGHDVNFAVTESMFRAFYMDRRFTPSIVQQELVDAGRLGRKSGRGFHAYPAVAPRPAQCGDPAAEGVTRRVEMVIVRGAGKRADEWHERFQGTLIPATREMGDGVALDFIIDGKRTVPMQETDGRTAVELAAFHRSAGQGVMDLALFGEQQLTLAVAYSRQVPAGIRRAIANGFAAVGVSAVEVADTPGLVVARTVCMLINEAADAVQQGVCSIEAADLAMRLGVNYPAGPFQWLDLLGTATVVNLLQNLGEFYRGERYRVSPWLQQRHYDEESRE